MSKLSKGHARPALKRGEPIRLPQTGFARRASPYPDLRPVGELIVMVGGEPVPGLSRGWQDYLTSAARRAFSDSELQYLALVARDYATNRMIYKNAYGQEELHAKLTAIDKAGRSIQDAMHNRGMREIWQLLSNAAKAMDVKQAFTEDLVRETVSALVCASTKALSDLPTDMEGRPEFDEKMPLRRYVELLQSFCQSHGLPTGISNRPHDEPEELHTSVIVQIGWTLMKSLPKELREHASSIHAFALAMRRVSPTAPAKRSTSRSKK